MTAVTSGSHASARITVHGPRGCFDAAVSSGTTPGEILGDRRARARIGLRDGDDAVLVTRDGGTVEERKPLLEQGVDDGDVLSVLVLAESGSPSTHRGRVRRTSRTRARTGGPVEPLVAALTVLVTAGLLAIPVGGAGRTAAACALLAAAVLGTVASPHGEWGDRCRLLAPLAAAAGVGILLASSEPGQVHLALTAAAVIAAITAATARARGVGRAPPSGDRRSSTSPPVVDELLVVLLVAVAVAAVLGLGLLAGASLRASGIVVAVVAVLTARLLPTVVMDAPDEALLELDRLAVTAWTAHDRVPRRGWRRLHTHDVSDLVDRARRHFGTTAVLVSALAVVGTTGALTSAATGLGPYGTVALAVTVALTLGLSARTVRHPVGRTSMLLAAALVALAAGTVGVAGADAGWRAVAFGSAVLVAACVVPAAVALGRGWRSVRWARAGDIVEGLAAALVLPAGFVAAGGFDWVRQLAS